MLDAIMAAPDKAAQAARGIPAPARAWCSSSATARRNPGRRFETYPHDGTDRKVHIIAFRGEHRAAGADQNPSQRALGAPKNAADDSADPGARTNLPISPWTPASSALTTFARMLYVHPLAVSRSNVTVRLPRRSIREARSTLETTPRSSEPAGTSKRSFSYRSITVVASKRSSTIAVSELSSCCSRASSSVPTGIS